MSLPSHETARSWPGLTVLDRDGDTVGQITHIYVGRSSGQPEWALVAVPERGRVFVPLSGAGTHGDRVRLLVAKTAVREAPEVPGGRRLSEESRTRLSRHYGVAADSPDRGARRASSTGRRARGAANRVTRLAGGTADRLQKAGGRVRGAATSGPAKRLLPAAGAASALGAAAALAGRSGRVRRGLTGVLDALLAAPAAAFRRQRRRRRLRAVGRLLGGAVTAPLRAAGDLPAPPRPRPRTRRSKMAGNVKLMAGLAAGYVMGARAGRERYERLAELARRAGERPEVRQLADRLRGSLDAGLDKATSRASDRLERSRTGQDTGSPYSSQEPDETQELGEPRAPGSSQEPDEERERPQRTRAARAGR